MKATMQGPFRQALQLHGSPGNLGGRGSSFKRLVWGFKVQGWDLGLWDLGCFEVCFEEG